MKRQGDADGISYAATVQCFRITCNLRTPKEKSQYAVGKKGNECWNEVRHNAGICFRLGEFYTNGHGNCATPDNETRDARAPSLRSHPPQPSPRGESVARGAKPGERIAKRASL